MPKIRESIETVNSALRTLLAFVVAGMIGAAGWFGYSLYHAPQKAIAAKQAELENAQSDLDQTRGELMAKAELVVKQQDTITNLNADMVRKDERIIAQDKQIARLETAMRLLKIDHRLADLKVLGQKEDAETGKTVSTVEFVEVNDDGGPIDEPRQFEIEGDLVYVECLVAKFEDKYVEASDLHRATSICLFQRIFGEFQEPSQGAVLDRVGARPNAYAGGGKISDFEQKIWDDFWNIANDRQRAKELGIRAAHIEAPGIKVRPGKTYRLLLRASGGLTITPLDTPGAPGI